MVRLILFLSMGAGMDDEEIRKRICLKCDFYKEGEKLECHAFKVSKRLVKEGKVSLDEL
jgi:hypothetical protein